ncbi:UNVERIFIED_CONTAM: hypothetical protein GTU68_054656 [Idotea baltica]|nr:hypothetical protein [Idotea baltica]
MTLAWL